MVLPAAGQQTFGQSYIAKRHSDAARAYWMPAHPQELAMYEFSNVIFGRHVMVKVHSDEEGVRRTEFLV